MQSSTDKQTVKPEQNQNQNQKTAEKGRISTRRITTSALLAALALALSWLESLIPFQPGLPGVKLGLPNLVIVFCLYRMNVKSAILVNVVRILLAGLMFSGLFGMLYSLCGAAFSMSIMVLLLFINRKRNHDLFSIIGVSMAGGVFHNLGQLLIAMLAVTSANLFFYFPVLIISGIVTGIINGIVAHILLQKLPPNLV